MLRREEQADNCTECGECEEQCPQEIPIAEWLEKAHAWLGPKPQS
jgi:predicted aldo/keto reductase-like oxidoreductase